MMSLAISASRVLESLVRSDLFFECEGEQIVRVFIEQGMK